jgi:hypothetical protein
VVTLVGHVSKVHNFSYCTGKRLYLARHVLYILDEAHVYFGDQFQLGEAILEVSEIREPCWKIQEKYKMCT